MDTNQGFHKCLSYSNKLVNAYAIYSISEFDQGWGIINNVGDMQTRALNQWCDVVILEKVVNVENVSSCTILNWNGQPPPVVHEYD